MRELKPCPLCGKKVSSYSMEVEDGQVGKIEIDCPSCNTHFFVEPKYMSYYSIGGLKKEYCDGDAIDTWNRRPNDVQDQNSDR